MKNSGVENLVEITNEILLTKYPLADFAFLAGSIIRNEGTKYSDLDIVVIFENLPSAFRESFYFQDFPVETFVHTPETLNYFFDLDAEDKVPSLAVMVSEGIVVPNETDLSGKLKDLANTIILNPPKITEEEIDRLRYQITDVIDDIREWRSKAELNASATGLYSILAEFYLRTSGYWSASRKSIPRSLQKANPDFCKRFNDGFEELFSDGKTASIIELTKEVLNKHGGFLFDEVKLHAPLDWRKPL